MWACSLPEGIAVIKLGLQSLSYRDTFLAGGIDLEGFLDRAGEMRLDGVDLQHPLRLHRW